MCVMSAVYDYFDHTIPRIQPTITPPKWVSTPADPDWLKRVQKQIEDFSKAKEAAAVVDSLTSQKDCVDLEKAKLEDRIKELEKLLANPPEFVLIDSKELAPGTYRIIDGVLYKVV